MRERPILFSAPMVRAILDGNKTQTRRVIKPQPYVGTMGNACWNGSNYGQDGYGNPLFKTLASPIPSSKTGRVLCPFGAPGDRLWVRETWQVARETLDYETGGEYDVWSWEDHFGDPRQFLKGNARFGLKSGLFYAADCEEKNPSVFYDLTGIDKKTVLRPKEINWRPSIHMPRWASRITLEITDVRVECLNQISEEDARAEGAATSFERSGQCAKLSHKAGYVDLWESINGTGSWEVNPWVWVVEFKRVGS